MYTNNNLRQTTKHWLTLLLCISVLVLVLFMLSSTHDLKSPKTLRLHIQKHVQIAHSKCEGTLYPELCASTVSTFTDLSTKTLPQLISGILNKTMYDVRVSSANCTNIQNKYKKRKKALDPIDQNALIDCLELFDCTLAAFNAAISDLSPKNFTDTNQTQFHDIQTLLSGAMTNQYTCLDGFAYSKTDIRHTIQSNLHKISNHISNSLAMLTKTKTKTKTSTTRRLAESEVFPEYGKMSRDGYPTWLSSKDRRMLLDNNNNNNNNSSTNSTMKYDLVVAKDGSGNFTTINEALAAAPNSSATRFVIYIKKGAYFEYVEVERKKTMLMFVGDGIGKTLIKGNRSVVDGWTTFRSSTLAVVGNNFLMKGITVENYSGPSKHQAVALRSGSDFSAFYQCSFVAYQDTLYVHSFRQFYRECDVYGTVDFIFGNAAVVFQNSNLYARKPNENQKNIFTAQGREDPNQNTGISIINCKVAAAADLIPVQSNFSTYLGRPWKEYSRTVFILSNIGDLVHKAGWLEWAGDFALNTLYYGEYKNRGPGSNTSARVTWPGYRVITNSTEASQFGAGAFIQGAEWLNSTGFPYYLNLTM